MGINFTYYQTSNRVPGVYVEMDPSQANSGVANQTTLLIRTDHCRRNRDAGYAVYR